MPQIYSQPTASSTPAWACQSLNHCNPRGPPVTSKGSTRYWAKSRFNLGISREPSFGKPSKIMLVIAGLITPVDTPSWTRILPI